MAYIFYSFVGSYQLVQKTLPTNGWSTCLVVRLWNTKCSFDATSSEYNSLWSPSHQILTGWPVSVITIVRSIWQSTKKYKQTLT